MRNGVYNRHSSVIAVACALSAASAASAQEVRGPERPQQAEQALSPATTATPAVSSSSSSEGLTDIVVVARRVDENLQRVPVAVTAQSGEILQRQNAVRIPDVARLTPGILFSTAPSTASASNITIRGQVQTDVLGTLDPSVGTYVDGFYWARAYGLNADLLDVQSAQVLRGPQGTLFGRNTTGGALLIQTNDPNFDGISGLVSGTYGRFNERVGTAVLNLPLGDKVAIRGAFTVNKRDGFFEDQSSDRKIGERDSYAGRAKILLKPTETLSLLFSAEYYRTKALTRPFQVGYVSPTSIANISAALEANPANAALLATPAGQGQLIGIGSSLFAAETPLSAADKYSNSFPPLTYARTQTYTGTATLDTYFGAVKIIGGYRKVDASAALDVDGSAYTLVHTLGTQSLYSYSGEAQIVGKAFDDAFDFVGGVFAFHEGGTDGSTSVALTALNKIATGGIVPLTYYLGRIHTNSMGIYGQGTYTFNERLSVVGGLRYSIDDKGLTSFNRAENEATGALLQCLISGADPVTCRIARSDEFKGLSYTFGLNYQVTPSVLVYAKTSKGFRSGGQNLRATGLGGTAFVPFEPEIAREHEVGFKGEFFDRRLRVNVAAFYNKVDDIQRTTLLSSTTNGVTTTTTVLGNAGKARFYGGEVEIAARLFPGFTLSATGALIRPKYLEFADSSGDRTDEVFQGIARETFSVAADYERDLGFGRGLAHIDYAWQGKTANQQYRTIATPGQNLVDLAGLQNVLTRRAGGQMNARLGVELPNGLELAVFGRNILNFRARDTGILFNAPLNVAASQRNDPVTYGITGTFRFGQ